MGRKAWMERQRWKEEELQGWPGPGIPATRTLSPLCLHVLNAADPQRHPHV